MRALSFCGVAALLAVAGPSAAQEDLLFPEIEEELFLDDPFQPAPPLPEPEAIPGDDASAPSDTGSADAPDETTPLDELFTELRRERSEDGAAGIAAQIQSQWLRSGSATIDLLMGWASRAMADENNGAALDLLEQAMLLDPDYAEAWNARATLNFQLSNYGRSLADIEQTLRREPRHFGALMGLGAILEELDRKEDAFEAYRRVLEVYPALRSAQDAVARLADEVGGQSL